MSNLNTLYPGWATKVAAEIAAEKRAADPVASLETMRIASIRREAARRGAADDTVAVILEGLTVVNADGEIVERDTGKSLDAFMDELQRTNPGYFAKTSTETAPAPKGVILDPAHPNFNATAATLAARDPDVMAELMARLAPKPMRVF